jgi:hypothetical protein
MIAYTDSSTATAIAKWPADSHMGCAAPPLTFCKELRATGVLIPAGQICDVYAGPVIRDAGRMNTFLITIKSLDPSDLAYWCFVIVNLF